MIDNDVDTPGRYTRRPVYNDEPESDDREISLGTPTILALFFGLAVICAAFFGFGYSLGHKSVPVTPTAVNPTPAPVSSSIAKPSAGVVAAPAAATVVKSVEPSTASDSMENPAASSAAPPAATPAVLEKPAHPAPLPVAVHTASPAPAPLAGPPPAGQFMVQVAAVSNQDVAEILLTNLRKKGYDVAVHHEPQDKLLHVQIGPFADKKQAEAMRQRILADGFNAIVK